MLCAFDSLLYKKVKLNCQGNFNPNSQCLRLKPTIAGFSLLLLSVWGLIPRLFIAWIALQVDAEYDFEGVGGALAGVAVGAQVDAGEGVKQGLQAFNMH